MVVLVGHSDSKVSQKVGSLGCGRLYAAAWKLYAVLVKDTFCAGGSICGINLDKFIRNFNTTIALTQVDLDNICISCVSIPLRNVLGWRMSYSP